MGAHIPYRRSRFKPVVRVKAPSRPMTLKELADFSIEQFNRLPPLVQSQYWREQRESWNRAELELSRSADGSEFIGQFEVPTVPANDAQCCNKTRPSRCLGCPYK